MFREDRFILSHRPYAIAPSSLHTDNKHTATVNAVWYRRRNGLTIACIGYLWDIQNPAPQDAAEFLARHTDGRYGGKCRGRWDGKRYWGAQDPEVIAAHLELLRPMLADYPTVPAGYDGWWRF